MSKKEYGVALPISGILYVTVEAHSEEEAIDVALMSDQVDLDNVEEWEAHEKLVEGNVFFGMLSEAYADEV